MASAVSVGATSTALRLPDDLDSDAEITGHAGLIDEDGDEDDSPRRTVEEDGQEDEDALDDDDDLFGDGMDDEAEKSPKLRKLDDEELDSGDDEGRADRQPYDGGVEEQEGEEQQFNFMDADIARHAIPEPSDNELYLLKIPRFLSIDPVAWHHKNFQPPTTDHHSKGAPSTTFSAYNTALTTIRWRHSPSKPSELQSNARILRWSDGSLTLQFASDPTNQYDLSANPLAPVQQNPKKPTPTSVQNKHSRHYQYNATHDSFTYLAAPYEAASVMRFTNKITTALSIVPAAESKDAALEQLQNALAAAAARGRDPEESSGITFIKVDEDPEVKKLQAEAAHKEKLRQQRTREKHEQKERERANRTLGRSGLRAGGGLTVGGLEDEEGGGRARAGARKPKAKSGLRRDWSDDDDYGGRRHNKEDEYDEEDDFIAASDEEEAVEDDDDDDDDGIVEAPRESHKGRARETQSPKRNRAADDEGDEEDVVANVARAKRRRVVEEDEDDE
ncbi:hypothetical protein K432DRAFT_323895 [Lepidopterella palustris CBS 459.81]|uniref:Leo1-like protein n=1 Tax=Lepidopterella palustris CBS 459.81 TaxID=1314670 RepID=A0A8E2EFM4_9PEZI|nr:hypothetical protein K432DRAFT_323895 [Lepidopterella palustris CBS 459.81]